MVKHRQKLKQKLRVTSATSTTTVTWRQTQKPTNQEEYTPLVITLLEKLRNESRSQAPPQTDLSFLHSPAYNYFLREESEQARQAQRRDDVINQRVSGPAPPPSWRNVWKYGVGKDEHGQMIAGRKLHKRAWDVNTEEFYDLPSLQDISAKCLAVNLQFFIGKSYFAQMPTHLKQSILYYASIYNPLNDGLFSLFANDEGYEELILANSKVSFEILKRAFWRIDKKHQKDSLSSVADPEHELKENGKVNGAVISNSKDNFTENCASIAPVGIQGTGLPTVAVKNNENKPVYSCSLTNLRRLNLAFNKQIPAMSIATLLSSTVPLLTHLSIAGCFDRGNGPHALGVLSRGLINLVFLDLSHCEWINDLVLMKYINWQRDLKYLRALIIVGCRIKDKQDIYPKVREDRVWIDIIE
ncbi:4555_t:CDS:2 [Paraglomus brasilianum]|uniref:4555_t:CDS:1 n=1 Tax=Paraglomus brasilianum TaxID=144538 RepID=A0A9N9FPB1_9GLOM|nr:4555_t:CDS:2 [Paraglomus brasilianum]